VGVVADTRTRGPARDAAGVLYRPIAQTHRYPATTAFLAVRSRGADGQLLATVRSAIRDADPSLPVYAEAVGPEVVRPSDRAAAGRCGSLRGRELHGPSATP
jgi:hypothetical protein